MRILRARRTPTTTCLRLGRHERNRSRLEGTRDRYAIERNSAKGGMATVYLAFTVKRIP
jgi:hypothetical protein